MKDHCILYRHWLLGHYGNQYIGWTTSQGAALRFTPSEAWDIAAILNAHRPPDAMVRPVQFPATFPSN